MNLRRRYVLQAEAGEDGSQAGGSITLPEEPAVDDVDWAALVSDSPEPVEEQREEPAEPAPVEPEPEPEPAPEQPAPPAEPQGDTQAPLSQEQLQELRGAWLADLERQYTINEDDATVLQTEPEKILPKMAAKMHAQIVEQVLQQVQQVVPVVVSSMQVQEKREAEARDAFYREWPELRGYEAQVLQAGQVYRSMYPKATPDEAIKAIGRMVMAAAGISREPKEPPRKQYRPAAPGGLTAPPREPGEFDFLIED